jgi:hypothetical protein
LILNREDLTDLVHGDTYLIGAGFVKAELKAFSVANHYQAKCFKKLSKMDQRREFVKIS